MPSVPKWDGRVDVIKTAESAKAVVSRKNFWLNYCDKINK
jgi:hypothetical protein